MSQSLECNWSKVTRAVQGVAIRDARHTHGVSVWCSNANVMAASGVVFVYHGLAGETPACRSAPAFLDGKVIGQ